MPGLVEATGATLPVLPHLNERQRRLAVATEPRLLGSHVCVAAQAHPATQQPAFMVTRSG